MSLSPSLTWVVSPELQPSPELVILRFRVNCLNQQCHSPNLRTGMEAFFTNYIALRLYILKNKQRPTAFFVIFIQFVLCCYVTFRSCLYLKTQGHCWHRIGWSFNREITQPFRITIRCPIRVRKMYQFKQFKRTSCKVNLEKRHRRASFQRWAMRSRESFV